MNTPKTDRFVMSRYANKESLYSDLRLSHEQLERELIESQEKVKELREALAGAAEELRLIRMKDTPAVYDPTLRIRMSAILEKMK